jgi:hypothetical protein
MLLLPEEQVSKFNAGDNLRKAAHKLNQITTQYGFTKSAEKTKRVAFK